MLQRDDFVGCHALLKRAQVRGQGDRAMFAITLNNLACYHRRRGHLKVALAHLSKAVDIEAHCDAHKPADTHLNLCAVQSELGNHHEAMHHAKVALRLLRDELGMAPLTPSASGRTLGTSGSAAGLLTGGGDSAFGMPPPSVAAPSAERMAVLAIAHHNLAVEQEALRLPEEASRSYGEAAGIASRQLGDEHPVASALRATYEANILSREKQMAVERKASLASKSGRTFSEGEKRQAELRKQASVQRHIELTRLVRRPADGSERKIKPVQPHVARAAGGVPRALQEGSEEGDIAAALREWLKAHAVRVTDLFKKWHADDGTQYVDKEEFRRAMRAFGLSAPASHFDALFDEYDAAGGGSLGFDELHRCLQRGNPEAPPRRVTSRPGSASALLPAGMRDKSQFGSTQAPVPVPAPVRPGTAAPRPGTAAPRQPGGDGRDDGFATAGEAGGAADVADAEADVAGTGEEDFETGMRQNAMEFDAADVNKDSQLDFGEFSKMVREREQGTHTEEELRARFDSIDTDHNQKIDLEEFIAYSLRDALSRSASRVIDLFRQWDEDESGSVEIHEFRRAIAALGFDAPIAEVDAVFKQLDADGSGQLEYKELNKMLRKGAGSSLDASLQPGAMGEIKTKGENKHALRRGVASGKKNAVLPSSVTLEMGPEGKPINEQLREILNQNAVRVIDLFRSWDDDGDGKISAKEFRKAIAALGYNAPKAEINAVFAQLDLDKSGEIDYHELNRALRRGTDTKLDPALQPGAAGAIATKATLKTSQPA